MGTKSCLSSHALLKGTLIYNLFFISWNLIYEALLLQCPLYFPQFQVLYQKFTLHCLSNSQNISSDNLFNFFIHLANGIITTAQTQYKLRCYLFLCLSIQCSVCAQDERALKIVGGTRAALLTQALTRWLQQYYTTLHNYLLGHGVYTLYHDGGIEEKVKIMSQTVSIVVPPNLTSVFQIKNCVMCKISTYMVFWRC